MTAGAVHVELAQVTKRYGATVAVDAVDLTFHRGQVHALIGENGAGKSTIGKIVAGIVHPDGGELRLAGRPTVLRSPRQALHHGITTIAQELSLVPARSVIENVYLGIEDHRLGIVEARSLARRFAALVERSGIVVAPDVLVRNLSVADRQKVEILRALARRADLIIMDEPTARLSQDETTNLKRMVRALAGTGTTIVFISHFLDEVLEIADLISIMRDGRIVRTAPASEETHASLIEGMIGRSLEATFPERRPPAPGSPEILRVSNLVRRGVFHDVSFTVRAGEIVAMAGLVGAGRSEVARAIFGADPISRGTVEVDGRALPPGSVRRAIDRGLAMIPESRKDQGLVLGRPTMENVTLPHLLRFSRLGIVKGAAERRSALEMIHAAGVRGISLGASVRAASGGNQQKLMFSRWLLARPLVLIADEPTRGVDVGSKHAIYDLLAQLAAEGMAILMISSELEEVLGLAHRILVMRRGTIAAELDGATATEADVMAEAFGTVAA